MESNNPPLPSPLAPNPLPLLLVCELALCLGERVKKNLVIFSDHSFPKQRALISIS